MKRRVLILAGVLMLLIAIGLTVVPRIIPHFYREAFPLIPGVEYGMSPKEASALLGPGAVIEEQHPVTGQHRRYESRDVQVMGQNASVSFDYLRIGWRYVLQAVRITVDLPDSAAADAFAMDAVDQITAAFPREGLKVSDRIDAATDQRVISVSWHRGPTGTDTSVSVSDQQVVIHGSTDEFYR